TDGESELMNVLTNSFMHSERLHTHMRFLYSKGSMYKTVNGNLLFHGCIPLDESGEPQSVVIDGCGLSGKELLDKLNEIVNRAYFLPDGAEKQTAADMLWYLWCGPRSPLYGKDKMAFFERYFLVETELHRECYNAYYHFSESAEVCGRILSMFGLDPKKGHIINGHVPVKISRGESPVKADGRLFVIDGGISKAYQKTTGIAGYTLIYDSHSLNLAEHKPFIPDESEHTPEIHLVERLEQRANISDTDKGSELLSQINDLKELLEAYRSGALKEK
ncbi:MAG: fructose-1,6-bisphosphatase, partial [Ruminococcus sp.]|nr:fructose-1,6-bisphosphatase [Ruminococcus sp.]